MSGPRLNEQQKREILKTTTVLFLFHHFAFMAANNENEQKDANAGKPNDDLAAGSSVPKKLNQGKTSQQGFYKNNKKSLNQTNPKLTPKILMKAGRWHP